MALAIVLLVNLLPLVASKVTLENPDFESPPTNLTTNVTSDSVLLDAKTNVIPGWSFNGTVWYITAGENISLPGNGHGLKLGPNGIINQTFKYYGIYDVVLTFTLAPSTTPCANNSTAVNVSGPGVSKLFFFKESLGNERWQTYAYSLGSPDNQKGLMSLEIKSVATTNTTCWPIIDTLLLAGIQPPRWYADNGFANSGFEVGPTFLKNSSEGILLEADSTEDLIQSPLQDWTILGIVKYIDSGHYAVPRGRAAVELISGGIMKDVFFLRKGEFSIEFMMGDANDSCIGDLMVFLQVGDKIWNFTMRSIGIGSREKFSVTFNAKSSNTLSVPLAFFSYNNIRTSDGHVLCGPVIDSTFLRFSSGLNLQPKKVDFELDWNGSAGDALFEWINITTHHAYRRWKSCCHLLYKIQGRNPIPQNFEQRPDQWDYSLLEKDT